ncbi:hypothetical protein A2Z33_06860 [Candidatus Gottesmanbacteria bacterium RBG_16_52_11]|uniref:EamA domain-containing protein n=1 Tax=Candidatus Gottesmanbacteria bacterium RBG_16_52_11 TaxID=1798374 RepID=A0A1F5YY11_9BACT|nr:MAG: hypothetical protein A2Z33_06860 [Candidatus Gottesmanbacteria bacterium RBG_16_52_11]
MHWVYFAAISVISISVANVLQRILAREEKNDPIANSIVFQFLVALFTGIYAVSKGFVPPPIHLFPVQFAVSTVFYGLGTLSLFTALKRLGSSEVTILSSFGALVTIAGSLVFLDEKLSPLLILGTFLILLSVFLVTRFDSVKIRSSRTAVFYALAGTSLYGLAVVSDTFILRRYDAVSYTPVISLLPGIFLTIIHPRAVGNIVRIMHRDFLKPMVLFSCFYGIQAVTYYLAIENGANASQMGPFAKSQIVLTVMLAAVFLKERSGLLKKIIATVLVTAGAVLIS